jgi:hypothetical protein
MLRLFSILPSCSRNPLFNLVYAGFGFVVSVHWRQRPEHTRLSVTLDSGSRVNIAPNGAPQHLPA